MFFSAILRLFYISRLLKNAISSAEGRIVRVHPSLPRATFHINKTDVTPKRNSIAWNFAKLAPQNGIRGRDVSPLSKGGEERKTNKGPRRGGGALHPIREQLEQDPSSSGALWSAHGSVGLGCFIEIKRVKCLRQKIP